MCARQRGDGDDELAKQVSRHMEQAPSPSPVDIPLLRIRLAAARPVGDSQTDHQWLTTSTLTYSSNALSYVALPLLARE